MAARNATLIHAPKTRQGGTGHRTARSPFSLVPCCGVEKRASVGGEEVREKRGRKCEGKVQKEIER